MAKEKRDPDQIKADMERARKLIEKGQYEKAQKILITIDHPTAEKWLDRINQMASQQEKVVVVKEKQGCGCTRLLAAVGALFVCLIIAAALYPGSTNPATNRNSLGSSSSNTARSTSAPAAGSRSNPFSAGMGHPVQDGELRVNGIKFDMDARIQDMNMFNAEPEAGEEWVLVNVTFDCQVSAEDTCVVSLMNFELVGESGTVYDKEIIAVLENDFSGEIFGGGSVTGDLGFIIDSDDTNLLLVVNEFGDRKFFAIP